MKVFRSHGRNSTRLIPLVNQPNSPRISLIKEKLTDTEFPQYDPVYVIPKTTIFWIDTDGIQRRSVEKKIGKGLSLCGRISTTAFNSINTWTILSFNFNLCCTADY